MLPCKDKENWVLLFLIGPTKRGENAPAQPNPNNFTKHVLPYSAMV